MKIGILEHRQKEEVFEEILGKCQQNCCKDRIICTLKRTGFNINK